VKYRLFFGRRAERAFQKITVLHTSAKRYKYSVLVKNRPYPTCPIYLEATMNQTSFLYPYHRYRGVVRPENLVFNANLQEFAQKVGYITNLETAGKLSPEEAYRQIALLWQQLQSSKKNLGVGESPNP
jgi:hypothetical protein